METKGKLIEEDVEQSPQVSVLQMEEYNINTIDVKWAEAICKSFGLKLNKDLIRTSKGYRECVKNPKLPRVAVSSLAEDICEQLGIEPNKKFMATANSMMGEGSRHSLTTQACCKVLRKKFNMEELY